MKILIVGGGGREHALAWKLAQSPSVNQIIAAPGNPGIAQLGTCVAAPSDVSGYVDLALAHRVDLTVVGPEAPLVSGIVDQFRSRNMPIVGPTQAAARLEGSKIFAKEFFTRTGIPTARSIQTLGMANALSAIKRFSYPLVIKADGLAAGKGVVIAQDQVQAEEAALRLGPSLVIEEFLEGEEVSFIGVSNGHALIPFAPSQDHKRAFDGDQGPNTGGMGAYTDSRILTSRQIGEVMERIMLPTLRQMNADGTPFTGFLYAGLMMTGEGPKILEFNVRLGDPETQSILHCFSGDLADLLRQMADGAAPTPPPPPIGCSVCVTLAAEGYPDAPRLGDLITGIREAEATGATVFHAGTKQVSDDLGGHDLVTSGGRVLGVTAGADTLQGAMDRAYAAVNKISFRGMHHRRDIAQKGLARW